MRLDPTTILLDPSYILLGPTTIRTGRNKEDGGETPARPAQVSIFLMNAEIDIPSAPASKVMERNDGDFMPRSIWEM
jgi:hypothetical protein